MDASGAALVAQSLGAGVAIGLSSIAAITIALLPASWVMNRFIYHTPLMRVILAVLAGLGSFLTFAIVLIGCATGLLGKPYYFGLLPTFLNRGGEGEPVGFFALLTKFARAIAHPFQMRYIGVEDEKGFEKTVEMMLVPKTGPTLTVGGKELFKGAVYEPFFEGARKVGAKVLDSKWREGMNALSASGVGQALFLGEVEEPEASA